MLPENLISRQPIEFNAWALRFNAAIEKINEMNRDDNEGT